MRNEEWGVRDARAREAEERTTWDGRRAMATSCAHVRAFVETRRDEIEAMMRASRGGGESESESESEDAWPHACAPCATTCSTAREMRDHAHEVFYDRAREALTCARCAAAGTAAAAFPLREAFARARARRGGGELPRGLRGSVNMGNTCFMASVVQALAAQTECSSEAAAAELPAGEGADCVLMDAED